MDERFLSRIGSYLPAWQIRPGDGQPEAAVLYAAWHMLDDTRMRMARLPEKHEILQPFLSLFSHVSALCYHMSHRIWQQKPVAPDAHTDEKCLQKSSYGRTRSLFASPL